MVTATCPVYIYAAVKLLKKCRKGNANCALKDKCQHFVTKWNAKIIQPLCNDTVEDYTEASSKQTDRFHIKLRWAQEINYHHHLYKNTIIIIMWYMYKCRCKNCSILDNGKDLQEAISTATIPLHYMETTSTKLLWYHLLGWSCNSVNSRILASWVYTFTHVYTMSYV